MFREQQLSETSHPLLIKVQRIWKSLFLFHFMESVRSTYLCTYLDSSECIHWTRAAFWSWFFSSTAFELFKYKRNSDATGWHRQVMRFIARKPRCIEYQHREREYLMYRKTMFSHSVVVCLKLEFTLCILLKFTCVFFTFMISMLYFMNLLVHHCTVWCKLLSSCLHINTSCVSITQMHRTSSKF